MIKDSNTVEKDTLNPDKVIIIPPHAAPLSSVEVYAQFVDIMSAGGILTE